MEEILTLYRTMSKFPRFSNRYVRCTLIDGDNKFQHNVKKYHNYLNIQNSSIMNFAVEFALENNKIVRKSPQIGRYKF